MNELVATDTLSSFKVGTFISESKNRFLCTVNVDGTEELCHIASSCRLDNFIDLRGKSVLLQKNASKTSTTRYSVLGVKYKKSYILLNTSWANKAIATDIHSRKFSFVGKRKEVKKETVLKGYKADFYIPDTKTIIEVKSVISTSSSAVFPTVFSERTIHQLELIESLLAEGYKGFFIIVALNPYAKEISLLSHTECYTHLKRCSTSGLVLKAFTCQLCSNGELHIRHEIPIKIIADE